MQSKKNKGKRAVTAQNKGSYAIDPSKFGQMEVVDEDFFEIFPRVHGVGLQDFEPCEWGRLQSHHEVESLHDGVSP